MAKPKNENELVTALAEMVAARLPKPPTTEEIHQRVSAAVADAIRSIRPIQIVLADGTLVGETAPTDHYVLPRLLRILRAGLFPYLWGPPGSGKTTLALRAAEILGVSAEVDTLDPTTMRYMLQGARTANGDVIDTPFARAWRDGGAYIAEEFDLAPASVQSLLNSALANGVTSLATGTVRRNERFLFVGTGNTPGRPTPSFPERRPMSEAVRDRLYFVHVPIDVNVERMAAGRELALRPEPTVRTCEPAAWSEWVERVRGWAERNAPTLTVTPRATLLGIRALSAGEDVGDVADGVVFRGADDTLKSKVLEACPLPA